MKLIDKIKAAYRDSNHDKHFKNGAKLAFCGTILMTIGAAIGLEYKDEAWGGVWDWADFWWTVAGGMVGQLCQVGVIFLIWRLWLIC